MAMFQHFLTFYFALAIMFIAFGVSTPFTELLNGTSQLYDATSQTFLGVIPLSGGLLAIGAALTAMALAVGSAGIPLLLGIIVAIIVIPMFTFPIGIINAAGTPDEIRVILTAVFLVLQFLFLVSTVTYAKGSGE